MPPIPWTSVTHTTFSKHLQHGRFTLCPSLSWAECHIKERGACQECSPAYPCTTESIHNLRSLGKKHTYSHSQPRWVPPRWAEPARGGIAPSQRLHPALLHSTTDTWNEPLPVHSAPGQALLATHQDQDYLAILASTCIQICEDTGPTKFILLTISVNVRVAHAGCACQQLHISIIGPFLALQTP